VRSSDGWEPLTTLLPADHQVTLRTKGIDTLSSPSPHSLRIYSFLHLELLRSRMNGNVHLRFCSRVGVATSRLRQRPEE